MRQITFLLVAVTCCLAHTQRTNAHPVTVQSRITTFGSRTVHSKVGEMRLVFSQSDIPDGAEVFVDFGFYGFWKKSRTAEPVSFSWEFRNISRMDLMQNGTWETQLKHEIFDVEQPTVFEGLNFYIRIVNPDGTTTYVNGGKPMGYFVTPYTGNIFFYNPENPKDAPEWLDAPLSLTNMAGKPLATCGAKFTQP